MKHLSKSFAVFSSVHQIYFFLNIRSSSRHSLANVRQRCCVLFIFFILAQHWFSTWNSYNVFSSFTLVESWTSTSAEASEVSSFRNNFHTFQVDGRNFGETLFLILFLISNISWDWLAFFVLSENFYWSWTEGLLYRWCSNQVWNGSWNEFG